MIDTVKKLIESDSKYQELLKEVFNEPYITNKDLLEKFPKEEQEIYKNNLENLVKQFILIGLTSQSGSSIESRVPQRIFIINPDIEEEIENVL